LHIPALLATGRAVEVSPSHKYRALSTIIAHQESRTRRPPPNSRAELYAGFLAAKGTFNYTRYDQLEVVS